MNKKNESQGLNLLEENLTKSILKLGLPMMLGSFAQALYHIADAFWVGKLGKEAVSAPGISYFPISFLIALGLGFSVAGTSLAAQYTGAGDHRKASRAAGNLILLLLVIPTVLSIMGFILAVPLLELMRTPADAFDLTLSYFRIELAGMPLSFPMIAYQAVMNGYGDSISPLKIVLLTAVINMVLDPVLIFGWIGFPALGVNGAAVTTLFTRGLASAIGLYLFFSGKKGIRLSFRDLKPDWAISRLLIKIGVPASVGFAGSSLGLIILLGIVNGFGTAVIASYTVGVRVVHFFMMPAMGAAAAVAAIIGQNLGADRIDRAKQAVSHGIMVVSAVIIPASLITAAFGGEIISMFVPGDPVVYEIGVAMFYIAPSSVIFYGWSSIIEAAFQGAGYTMPVMVVNILQLWVFRIPFIYLLSIVILGGPENMNASVGIWWGMVFSNVASFSIMAVLYKKGTWATARIKKEKELS